MMAMVVGTLLAMAPLAFPQGSPPGHVILPPAVAGTPLSFQVHAQAAYFAAYGDMVESTAVARKINAEAAALELQQSIEAVKVYFERHKLNQEGRKLELDPQEREKRCQDRIRRSITEQYQAILERGGLTRPVNWLLHELAGPTLAYQYLPGGQTLTDSKLDQKLSPDELKLIRLTDGGGKIKTLVVSAGEGKVLEARWPFVLQAPEFKELREQFEKARHQIIDDARDHGEISYENAKSLRESVIALMVGLEEVYPEKVRPATTDEFVLYITSKRFLQRLRGSVDRAISTANMSVFAEGLQFKGDSLVALMQHMYALGLEFAPPEPGGEGVYKMLFEKMRDLYAQIGSTKPEPVIPKP
jgi:hypothetical protein